MDEVAMLDLTLSGFRDALARVTAAPAAVAVAMFVPLTEAVWWAICADDAFELRSGYRSARNSDSAGRTLLGLRYARSALGHHRTFIAKTGGGLTIPFTIPFAIETYAVWAPVEELPPFEQQASLRPSYVENVAEKAVIETLTVAGEWFSRARTSFEHL